jgi:hypothetical protein
MILSHQRYQKGNLMTQRRPLTSWTFCCTACDILAGVTQLHN